MGIRAFLSICLAIVLVLGLIFVAPTWAKPNLDSAGGSVPRVAQGAAASPITTVFQRWSSPDLYYAGVADTFINQDLLDTPYGNYNTMKASSAAGGRERILIKFDISRIPTNATVLSAKLNLYVWWRQPTNNCVAKAYKVKKHWNENEATWGKATSTSAWSQIGCSDPTFDYDPTSVATTTLKYVGTTYSWNLSDMAQQWVTSPIFNEGVLIVLEGMSTEYQFRPSDIGSVSQRPFLVVTYDPSGAPPTPTSTATPTLTRTPTLTQTPTHIPTNTETPRPTETPRESPTPTSSPTATLPPTTTPTRTPVPPPTVQDFQQGVAPSADYAGASDTFLSSYRVDSVWGGEDTLRVSQRSTGSERTLLRFDLQHDIPANAQVLSAKLSLFVSSRRTLYGMRIDAYDISRAWDVNVATWRRANPEQLWSIAGCDEVTADRQGAPLDSKFVYFTGQDYEWDVSSTVQRWLADPSTNHGVVLIGLDVDQDMRFRSSEWLVPEQRPKLTVTYKLP
jgi:hypothetical protein